MARIFISSALLAERMLPGLAVQFDSVIQDPVYGDFCFEISGVDVPDTGEVALTYEPPGHWQVAQTATLTPIAEVDVRDVPAAVPVTPTGDQVAKMQRGLAVETKDREVLRRRRQRTFVR